MSIKTDNLTRFENKYHHSDKQEWSVLEGELYFHDSLRADKLVFESIHALPCDLNEFKNLRELKLVSLKSDFFFPCNFPITDQLTSLIIGTSSMKQLPSAIKKMHNLKILHFTMSSLSTLPSWIGHMNLQELNVSSNCLISLPEEIGDMEHLEVLILSNNRQLAALPDTFQQLKHTLQTIAFDFTAISLVSSYFQHFTKLTKIKANIDLDTIDLASLSGLEYVDLRILTNQLAIWLRFNDNIKRIRLDRRPTLHADSHLAGALHANLCQEYGAYSRILDLSKYHALTDLCVSHFNFDDLDFSALHSLRRISMNSVGLRSFPSGLSALPNIEEITIRDSHLSTIPSIRSETLHTLSITGCKLKTLPEDFCVPNLVKLDLQNNLLSNIPYTVGFMKKLTYLDLSNNRISNLPYTIHFLKNLVNFHLIRNPIYHYIVSKYLNIQSICNMHCDCRDYRNDLKINVLKIFMYITEDCYPHIN